jgi:hypothetical protein
VEDSQQQGDLDQLDPWTEGVFDCIMPDVPGGSVTTVAVWVVFLYICCLIAFGW